MSEPTPSTPDAVAAGDAVQLAKVTGDFDFLRGPFDVVNRRLISPLSGRAEWEEFPATAIARTHFNGAVSVDEMRFPTKGSFGMSIRLFDPAAEAWTVYWVNSETGRLQAPVRGRWVDGVSLLSGEDEHDGTPVRASYRWSEVTDRTARWEQGFSTDGGETWETNWTMHWTRRADEPEHRHPRKPSSDFDFLVGRWHVAHRRLSAWLSGSSDWVELAGTAAAWTYFNGAVSVDEFDFPTLASRGLTIRLFDPRLKLWSIYWVSSRDGKLGPPVHGSFDGGVGEFYGEDVHNGQPVSVRYIWSDINEHSARWEQAFSTDRGGTWETNWVMRFTRTADHPR